MLTTAQRTKILLDIDTIAYNLGITVLSERARIENLTDFPLIQTTFMTEGRRQSLWASMLHDYQDPISHQWESHFGHFAQATVSISLRTIDVDTIQPLAFELANALWKQVVNWTFENTSKIEFRGGEAPRFLPPYLAVDDRTDIYTCVIDIFIDYEFTWKLESNPIKYMVLHTEVGPIGNGAALPDLISIAPGTYVMSGVLSGNSSAYRVSATLLPA
jgi:hypothetical protein